MPTMLPAIAAIGGLIGGGISAYGQYQQGQQAKQAQNINAGIAESEASIARANAEVSIANAGLIRQNAILNEYRQRKTLAQTTGTQVAQYAKAGVAFTGSPLDVIADSLSNAELEIAIGKANSEIEARNMEIDARNKRNLASGKMTESRLRRLYGREAEQTSYFNAASTLLSSGTESAYRLSKEKFDQ